MINYISPGINTGLKYYNNQLLVNITFVSSEYDRMKLDSEIISKELMFETICEDFSVDNFALDMRSTPE